MTATGLMVAVLVFGFLVFAAVTTRPGQTDVPSADGIVVLTGGPQRIAEAGRLLRENIGRRLLISGVNRVVKRNELRRLVKVSPASFQCCIDIGYAAQNTRGNAIETRNWARKHRFKRLIVVTASFHMPRSLTELASVMPAVDLIPYPILTARFRKGPWWLDGTAILKLASEYLKFLPSAANYALARMQDRLPNGEQNTLPMRRAVAPQ